jgi:hypothetical protein
MWVGARIVLQRMWGFFGGQCAVLQPMWDEGWNVATGFDRVRVIAAGSIYTTASSE